MADKQTYNFTNEIDTIEVSSLGAKIIMQPGDRSDIYVEYTNPKDSPEFCAVLSGKSLTLKESFSFSIFGSKPAEDYQIFVELPRHTYQKIKINTASGGVEIGQVSADSFSLNTASGNINVNAFFNDVRLQSASGNIMLNNPGSAVGGDGFVEVKESGIAKSLNICTVSGNATVSGYRTEEFGVHSVSGTTSVTGISGKGSVSATSGNVNLSYAEWDGDLNISLISGNVNVELPADSGMDLSFSGVSGMLKTDLGREKGSFMNLGKGTNGEFGGANKHKVSASLTSGTVTVSQR